MTVGVGYATFKEDLRVDHRNPRLVKIHIRSQDGYHKSRTYCCSRRLSSTAGSYAVRSLISGR